MRVLMLNTFDEVGGAARAATRLLDAVCEQKIDAKLLVQFKQGNNDKVLCRQSFCRNWARRLKILVGLMPVKKYPNKPINNFTPSLLPDKKFAEIRQINPDIVHLHWIGAGFLQIETLAKIKKPLVWTLHDSWAFTGGCHVPFDCKKYQQRCGGCPVLGSMQDEDLSHRVWQRKALHWRGLDLTVVVPSRWLADSARSSSLFHDTRIETIPYGLDTAFYQPLNKQECRSLFNLPLDKKIILFGAVQAFSDPNKGFYLLQAALKKIGEGSSDKVAVIFSSLESEGFPDLGVPAVFVGRVEDENLPALYSASDVFVLPSKLENLPLTVLEAMACGTPCVGFQQGGVPDEIDHKINGYLAQAYDTEDLAKGIAWVLENENRRLELSANARQKAVTAFSREREAKRYAELYKELLG